MIKIELKHLKKKMTKPVILLINLNNFLNY